MAFEFFDNNATTPLSEASRKAMVEAEATSWLNPSSPYRAGAKVRVQIDLARETLANAIGTSPSRVIFNSGATEGNNAVFSHWSQKLPRASRIGVSPTEHASVLEAAEHYFKGRIVWLPLTPNGSVDVDAIDLSELSAVSVMAANNETGILNPWRAIAAGCRDEGIPYHCDASQWLGKLSSVDLGSCDYVTGCAHKFGGPKGMGFLVLPAEGASAIKIQFGGSQEMGARAGTENVAGIFGLVAALEASPKAGSASARDCFETALMERLPECEIVGAGGERLWNTSGVVLPKFENVRWIRALEKRGFLVSTGSACISGKPSGSPVLEAMGYDGDAIRRFVRISSSDATSPVSWGDLLNALVLSYEDLSNSSNADSGVVISH